MCSIYFAMEIVSWNYQESRPIKSTHIVIVHMLLLYSVVCDQYNTSILKSIAL